MKMINKTITKTLVFAVLLFVGCDGLLDISPTQSIDAEIATSTPANLDAVLIGAYNALSDDDLFGGELYFNAELFSASDVAPEIAFTGTFSSPQEVVAKAIQVTNGQALQTWNAGYFAINQANIVLANIETYDVADRDRKSGEALFIRGIIYFELAKFYSQPYSAGSTGSNLGVPIMLAPDNFDLVSRETLQATYDQAIADLTAARDVLPTTNGVYATSHAANAILARIYLQTANYTGAAAAANAVIISGDFTLEGDFADAFNNSSVNSSEDIFAIQISATDGAQSMNTFFASSAAGGRGDVGINAIHTDLYEAGDARADFFYNDEPTDPTTTLRTTKWQNQFGNIPVVRLSEMYLTRAEANLRETTVVGATPLADVNTVRARAGLAPLLLVDLDLAAILLERKLELAFEGQLLHDLKRTQGSVGSFAFDADELLFPIPQAERDVNPNLVQNSGYTN